MKNITSANSTFTVSHNTTILDAARRYAKRGCAITPIEFRAKKPILPGWQRGGVPEESFDEHFGSPPCNIGIVLGDPSNGLVDVDLDDPDAIPFADKLLPSTGCVFGRPSRPRSHRLYQVTSAGRKDAFIVSGHTIVELRGNGHLTVFPGSIHPSGEVIQFDGGSVGDPGAVEWPDLEKAVCKIAIATLLFKKWVRGSRHPISLHAAGFLHNLGWTQTEAHDLIRLVATQAKDEEPFDRLESVKTTYEAAARGKPISGRRELVQLLGADAASAMEKWCGSAARRSSNSLSASDITSDAGAADAFADAKRDQLIFRDDTNLWFQKHRQVFRPISPVQAQGQAKEFMQERVASTGSWLATRSLLSKAKIDNLLTLSRHRFRVEPDLLDEARHLVGCADGMVLDLESQDIVPETTSIVTRMCAALSRPRPTARSSRHSCARFLPTMIRLSPSCSGPLATALAESPRSNASSSWWAEVPTEKAPS